MTSPAEREVLSLRLLRREAQLGFLFPLSPNLIYLGGDLVLLVLVLVCVRFSWSRIIRMRCQPVSGRDVYSWRQPKLPDFHADFIDRFPRWWPWCLIARTAPMIPRVIINHIWLLVPSHSHCGCI